MKKFKHEARVNRRGVDSAELRNSMKSIETTREDVYAQLRMMNAIR